MAEAAEASGATGIGRFSGVGSGGWNPQNYARDLRRATGLNKPPWPLYWFNMPVWNDDTGVLDEEGARMPMLLPHEAVVWWTQKHPTADLQPQGDVPWWPKS